MPMSLANTRVCLFASSVSTMSEPFALVHCDVWTSLVLSTLGYKYYLVMPDDFSHFYWSFPLPQKFKVYGRFVDFVAYAQTRTWKQTIP